MRCLIYILFLTPFFSYSQSISRSVIASQGDFYNNTFGSLSWTIGEISVETYNSSNSLLTQGFQQPDSIMFTSINELNLGFDLSIAPNPASDLVTVKTNSTMHFDINVIDVLGKEICNKKNCFESERINFSELSTGTYFITVSNKEGVNRKYKCFKID